MSWEDAFKVSAAVIASLGGSGAIVLSLSSCLGRFWASKILQREKLELDKLRKEHEVRFSKLYLERAEAIKEIAMHLQSLDDAIHSCLKDFQPVSEATLEAKIQQTLKVHNEYVALYKRHRLFFSKETAARMHKIALCSRSTYIDVTTYPVATDDIEYQFMPDLLRERGKSWKQARQTFYGDMQLLIKTLEDEFRQLLGIQ